MATEPWSPILEHEEGIEAIQLELDEFSNDVEVNIAIFGKSGSGRSSFVHAILGSDSPTITIPESNDGEPTSYTHPQHPKVIFWLHTINDTMTRNSFENQLESIDTEKFDVFLLFTADQFTKKHVMVAKKFVLSEKPLFFVLTKFDDDNYSVAVEKEAKLREIRASLKEHSKVLKHPCKLYPISNLHPFEWDFLTFTKTITEFLYTSNKINFGKIAKVQELILFEKFQRYAKEDTENGKQKHISVREIKKLFQKGGIVGVQRQMNKDLNRWKQVKINLAILGESGVGKSSFINAIRGVEDDADNAAATGVTETTIVPTSYEHPTNPNIRFWDLPGIGTPNCSDISAYCEKVSIEMYDTFLIICSRRFLDNDLKLVEKVKSMGKSFFFIRTKIDQDKRSEMRKSGFNENEMLEKIRKDCAKNLEATKMFDEGEVKIFLISSREKMSGILNV